MGRASGADAGGAFTGMPHDLRPDLDYKWTAAGPVDHQGTRTAGIIFTARAGAPGSVQKTQVAVTVTDQDGLTATESLAVDLVTPSPRACTSPASRADPGVDGLPAGPRRHLPGGPPARHAVVDGNLRDE